MAAEKALRTVPVKSGETDLGNFIKTALKSGKMTLAELSEKLDRSPNRIQAEIEALRNAGYVVDLLHDGRLTTDAPPKIGTVDKMIIHSMDDYGGKFNLIGACGDNHLGSNHERMDVLNMLYDVYAREGVADVFNTGNWIEGEAGRLNFSDIKVFGMDDQIDYWIDNYPQRKGITTHFIAGDDHEGWYQKKNRVEIGNYAMIRAQQQGRNDLHYIGYGEADVELRAKNGSRIMKVVHPGGGSAYALSYSMQKWVESLQGGEKPTVVLAGHYHKFDYNYYREVYVVQTGCTVDQSMFMRKLKLQAHVGGCLLRYKQADDGRITRFQVEWLPVYDRGFYTEANRREFTKYTKDLKTVLKAA